MRLPDIVRLGVLCVIYFTTAKFGLSLDAVSGFAAAVWPPTGIALVALVLYGYRLWPGIALGAFLVNLSVGAPVLVAGGMALGNTLEALLGTVLLTRVVGFRPALDRLRDVLGLIVLAAGLSTLLSATIGVTSGWLGGSIPTAMYGDAWRTWWLGDALGDLVVAPLLFVWSRRGRVSLPRRWSAEAVVLLVAVSVLSLVVFDVLAPTLPLPRYLVFPALIWVALRLGPPGSVTALALVSASAIWGTAQGAGPFAGPTLHDSLFVLQTFMSLVAVTILILAAVIAERGQTEATAREQRERFEVTLFSIGDAVIATDSQGRVTFMNPVAEALTGWPEAEALGQDITAVCQIVNEYTRQVVENPIAKVMRVGTVVGLANHTLLIARDGVEHPIDDSGAPIRDPQGRLLGIVVVFRDITERRRAEEARTRLAAIVESSEDAIIGKTLEGMITSWNRGAERIYGYTAEEVLGRPITMLVPLDHPNEIPAILARLAQGEAIDHYETVRFRQDGRTIPVSLTISPIRAPGGEIIGASTIARDITARKQAEAVLRDSEARQYAILQTAVDGIITIDEGGIVESLNPAAERLFGYTADEVIGHNINMLMPSPYREAHDDYLARYCQTGEAYIIGIGHEVHGQRRDGTTFPIALAVSEVRLGGRRIFTGIVHDLSARVQAEEALRQAHDELAQLVRERTTSLQEKEVLLKEIHHRVKNNLQIISSLLSLQSDAIADPHLLAQFQDSQDRVRSMALVHETLYQSQDLAQLDMAPYIRTLSAQLLQSYDVDPPRIALRMQVDRLSLNLDQAIPCGLILNELLTNAFKYAFPPSHTGVVHVELHSVTAQQAALVVRDTGIGFPAGLDFRHTETLGLQLVCILTEQLGGTITLERTGGTTFTLTFPVLTPEI